VLMELADCCLLVVVEGAGGRGVVASFHIPSRGGRIVVDVSGAVGAEGARVPEVL
jgi:hypothetical protein